MFTITSELARNHRDQLLEEARRHRLAQLAAGPKLRRRFRRWPAEARPTGPDRWWALAVALVGLIVTALSARALLVTLQSDDAASNRAVPGAISPVAAVVTTDLVYEPGHSSGWHVHPGVHSVVVLSGILTVYDEGCRRHDYGPGQTYVGGREPHLAVNAGAEAVGLVVTYVADPGADTPGSVVPAPAGCESA